MSPNHQVSKALALYKHLIEVIFFLHKKVTMCVVFSG